MSELVDNYQEEKSFEDRLRPSPETSQFSQEMATPTFIEDPVTGINYATYTVNQDQSNKPVVLNLGWSVGAANEPGRNEVKAYASHYDGPITVIDTEATGQTSVPNRHWIKNATFDDIAASRLRVLDSLGLENFDIVGHSMGGVVAAKVAALAHERLAKLVTISTVSFKEMPKSQLAIGFVVKEGLSQRDYKKQAPKEIQEEVFSGFAGSLKSLPTLFKLYKLMSHDVTSEAIRHLSPETKWFDFVGSLEHVTNWSDHLRLVRERNDSNPHSSYLYVLGSETHAWDVYINSLAEAAASTLMKI